MRDGVGRAFQLDGVDAIDSACDLAQACGKRVGSCSAGQVRMLASTSLRYNHGLMPSGRQVPVKLVRITAVRPPVSLELLKTTRFGECSFGSAFALSELPI